MIDVEQHLEQRSAAPPEQCPDLWTLIQLEAGPDTGPLASYWRTCQLCTHLMSNGALREPWTGAVAIERLSAVLASLNEALDAPPPILAADSLARIVEHSAEALAQIFAAPRRRQLRTHEVLPLHHIRDFDARSVAWLARQPGDTMSDKLGRRQRALAPFRVPDIDLPENRLARQLALKLGGLAKTRLERASLPSPDSPSLEGRRLQLMQLASRLGALANGPEFSGVANVPVYQPNNALLADPHYRRAWQAWTWLAQLEPDVEHAWNAGLDRLAEAQFWALIAVLCRRVDTAIDDCLVLREPGFSGEGFGIRAASQQRPETQTPAVWTIWIGAGAWLTERAAMLTLQRLGSEIIIEWYDLRATTALRPLSSPKRFSVRVGIKPTAARHAQLSIVLTPTPSKEGPTFFPANNRGLRDAARFIRKAVLPQAKERPPPHEMQMPDWIGLDVSGVMPRMVGKDGIRVLSPALLAIGEYRTDGHAQRPAALAQHPFTAHPDGGQWHSVPAALAELERKQDVADATLANLNQGFAAFWRPFLGPDGTKRPRALAIGVPSQLAIPAQRGLRRAAGGPVETLERTWLIERAVAAALGWQSLPQCPVKPGWHIIVVDCEANALTLTRLVADGDGGQGIFWIRDLNDREALSFAALTGRGWLADYLRLALQPAVAAGYATHEQAAGIAARLIAQGEADRLVDQLGSVRVPLLSRATPKAVLWLNYDAAIADEATRQWIGRFKAALDHHKETLVKLLDQWAKAKPWQSQTNLWDLLYVGRPFREPDRLKDAWGEVEEAGNKHHVLRHRAIYDSHLLVARGGHEFLRRYNANPPQPTWRERQAEQSVEIEIEGEVNRLTIMKSRLLGPGEEINEEVSDTLRLPKNQSQFILPILSGSGRARSYSYSVRLRPPGLPLSFEQLVKLILRYRYGDQDYRLFVRPKVGDGQPEPFPETEAELLPVLNTAPRFQAMRPPSSWFEGFALPSAWPENPARAAELDTIREHARSYWLPQLRGRLPELRGLPSQPQNYGATWGPVRRLADRIGALRVAPDAETLGDLVSLLDDDQPIPQNESMRLLGRLLRDPDASDQVEALKKIVERMFLRTKQRQWRQFKPTPFHFVTVPMGALALVLAEAPGFLPLLQLKALRDFGAIRLAEFDTVLVKPLEDDDADRAFHAFLNLCKLMLALLQARDLAAQYPDSAAPFEAGAARTYEMAKGIIKVEARFQQLGYLVPPNPAPVAGQERDICRALYRFLAGHERQPLLSYERPDED